MGHDARAQALARRADRGDERVHDFWLGPRATRLAREDAPAAVRERWRRVASWMGRTTFLLSLAVMALAVTLVR